MSWYTSAAMRKRMHSGKYIQFDAADADIAYLYNGISSSGYASRYVGGGRKLVLRTLLHREIVGRVFLVQGPFRVDHVNGNKLDNRRKNLRLCTTQENSRNSKAKRKGYKGVYWEARRKRFVAQINIPKKKWLGRFLTEREAARAYDEAAKRYFGEFAYLNFRAG